ncbi:MAG: hypothetical protein WC525_09165 [Candidatus Thermoplasmatota archaeon]
MTKKTITPPGTAEEHNDDRETKIINVLCNTSLVLMAMLTEAVSAVFTTLSKEMITALAASFGGGDDATKNRDEFDTQIPEQFRKELMTMKQDFNKQLHEKRKELGPLLADPRFDTGLAIVERTSVPLPKITQELDERSLFGYLALLLAADPSVTALFKELFEWMNTLPQPEKTEP